MDLRFDSYMFIAVLVLFFSMAGLEVYAGDSCTECHRDGGLLQQNKVLYDYFKNWEGSLHDLSGVICSDCHGGNPESKDKDSAHANNFYTFQMDGKQSYEKVPETCGKCHEAVLNNFRRSNHYKALTEKGTGPNCVTCHGAMNVEVYYSAVITKTCVTCHNEETGNRPEIVDEAGVILQRINVSRAFKNWIEINCSDDERANIKVLNVMYSSLTESWHSFDFKQLDQMSLDLLNRAKTLVNKGLIEKRRSN
ncbi:MAG: hypothetical protein ISR96_03285 [Nitrospira sp.]|nr:hypothetical protein [bacterium]MBL7048538.1 hypothetical protein [Nitrospira sp.]